MYPYSESNYRNMAKRMVSTLAGILVTTISVGFLFSACSGDGSTRRSELMKIEPSDAYHLLLSAPKYPDATFSLWLPELVIFNDDFDRAECVEREDWYQETKRGILVAGETEGKQKISFECQLTPISEDELLMHLSITNRGETPLTEYAQLAICLSPDHSIFWDSLGTRTFLNTGNNQLLTVAEYGDAGAFNHYPVGIRTDPEDEVERNRIADGYVAAVSQDGKLILSFCWDESSRVDVNPGGLKCIHSHPAIGPLNPGETLRRKGLIMIKESTVQDNYTLMKARLSEQ